MLIRELGRGRYSDCFKVSDAAGSAVAMKLSYYQEATIRAYAKHTQHGDLDAAQTAKEQDAISVSMAMAEVAKQMRLHGVSPHFVQVYCEADVRYLPKRLKALLRERLPLLTPRQTKYSHVCLMKLFTCNLTAFLASPARPTDATLRALVFQVVYTLACLQKLFPGFRHNDLSTNNVLVKPAAPLCTRYVLGDAAFYVCNVPHLAALADFDFTHVPGHDVLSNERVLGGKYKISPEPNNSYDTHVLLKSMAKNLKRRVTSRCRETLAFIKSLRLDPARDRLDHAVPHLAAARLLSHPYFAPLRVARPWDQEYAMPT